MADIQVKFDFENTPLKTGDEVVFSMTGIMGRGRILAVDIPNVFGCVLVQSLIDPTRKMVVLSRSCVLFQRPAQVDDSHRWITLGDC